MNVALTGKVAVVTGGSRGLGKEMVWAFVFCFSWLGASLYSSATALMTLSMVTLRSLGCTMCFNICWAMVRVMGSPVIDE